MRRHNWMANEILSKLKKYWASGGLNPGRLRGRARYVCRLAMASSGLHCAFCNSEGGSTEAVHSGLARQVSSLLTNHLARATECCGNQAAGNDALQDVLSLLNDLSRYRRPLWSLGQDGFLLE